MPDINMCFLKKIEGEIKNFRKISLFLSKQKAIRPKHAITPSAGLYIALTTEIINVTNVKL